MSQTNSLMNSAPRGAVDDQQGKAMQRVALNALRHWWKVCLPVGLLLAAIAAAIVYVTFVPQYKATATLYIASKFASLDGDIHNGNDDLERFIATQEALMKATWVLEKVMADPAIAKLPEILELKNGARDLAEKIEFGNSQSQYYPVSFTGPNAQHAALIINAVVREYLNQRRTFEGKRINGIVSMLREELKDHKEKAAQQKELVRQLAQKLGHPLTTFDQPTPQATEPPQSAFARKRAMELEFNVMDDEARLQVLENLNEEYPARDEVDAKVVDTMVNAAPEVQQLEKKIDELHQKQEEIALKTTRGKDDPRWKSLQEQIDKTQAELDAKKAELREQAVENAIAEIEATRQRDIREIKLRIKAAKEQLARFKTQIEQIRIDEKRDVEENVKDELELQFAQQDLARTETLIARISARIEELLIEEKQYERVTLADAAKAPLKPVEMIPLKLMGMAGGGAFVLPFLLAFAWEFRLQRLSDATQLSLLAHVPVLAEISAFPVRASSSKALSRRVSRALRTFEESVHGLRTHLVLSESLKDKKVFAIVSSVTQEGKTSVATQLALSLTRSRQRVLLIDGDLRSPDVHRMFDLPKSPGLAEYLQGEAPLSEVIDTSWSQQLHVLPAGSLSVDPHLLLGNGAIRHLLDEVRDDYDAIVIDTPPVLAASEALVMAKAADAALLCTMRDTSRLDQVEATCRKLVGAGAAPVGAVFSGVSSRRYYRSYGNYDYDHVA